MKNKYQEALQNLYDMRSKLIDVSSKNTQWANNIKIYDFIGDQLRTIQELVDKMKPIEEDLGCPLDVVFKALKGINYENEFGDLCQYQRPRLYYSDDLKCWCWELFLGGYVLPLKDHKKTWWLSETKEE